MYGLQLVECFFDLLNVKLYLPVSLSTAVAILLYPKSACNAFSAPGATAMEVSA
jgi:hypothetical protein